MTQINLLILDVDGVLTDGTKLYGADGKAVAKCFADIDFTAIKKLQEADDWDVCWLSADNLTNQAVAKERGIDFYYSREPDGAINKVKWLIDLVKKYDATYENTIYVGDDLYDMPAIQFLLQCGGKAYCPSNAAPGVKKYCTNLVSSGGHGAIMELYCLLTNDYSGVPPKCG